MKNRLLNAILLCICVVLAVICCILTIVRRNEGPCIQSEDVELVYHEGMSEEDLLKGLTAIDKEDGDITDRILIRSKVVTEEGLTVTYMVWDSGHERDTYTRIYEVPFGESISEEEQSSTEGQEDGQEASGQGTQSEYEETASEAVEEETTSVSSEEDNVEESISQPEPENEVPQAEQEQLFANPEAPILELSSHSAVIEAGGSFHYWDYIAAVGDETDDFEYLSSQIVLDGQYDVNVPGTYTLLFWVMDSDGNSSVPQELVLTVQ